jgi:hypothetical protein
LNRLSYARLEKRPSIPERLLMLKRIFLAAAIAGVALAHGVVLYKIDSGVRSSDLTPTIAAASHKAFW